MTAKEIEIRGLELDIAETKLNKEEFDSQIRFEERRNVINRERTDLDIAMIEIEIAKMKVT